LSLSLLYGSYFGNFRTLAALLIPIASILILYVLFRKVTTPRTRSWSLGLMLSSSVFLWLFVAVSLVLCYTFAELYEYQLEVGVRTVFASALLVGIVGGIPLSILLRNISPRLILSKVKDLHSPPKEITGAFRSLAAQVGVPSAQLKLSSNIIPVSFAIQTDQPLVVMSDSLLSLLKKDEIEAVMAHELAHIKNSDTALKALVTAYRTALPHDPIVRLVEAAYHREREMVADETAARTTRKPLSLASALLKIYEAFPKNNLSAYGTLSILGAGSSLMSRHPPIRQRISLLIRLADTYH
jgi:Zn-dependent protease with chaperone function